jgi:hypothetical protein
VDQCAGSDPHCWMTPAIMSALTAREEGARLPMSPRVEALVDDLLRGRGARCDLKSYRNILGNLARSASPGTGSGTKILGGPTCGVERRHPPACVAASLDSSLGVCLGQARENSLPLD